MKSVVTLLASLAFAFPTVGFAHATPYAYLPDSGSRVAEPPSVIVIRFSERVDPEASFVRVEDPSGTVISSSAERAADDPRTLRALLSPGGEGAYTVSWSVVSEDDGHFTRGSYLFAVGEGAVLTVNPADFEIVQVRTTPEALAMTLELLGNGVLWALLALLMLVVRPLMREGELGFETRLVYRGYAYFVLLGAAAILFGGAAQVMLKSWELASMRGTDALSTVPVFLGTTIGGATLARMGAALVFAALFFLVRRRIFASASFSVYDGLLAAPLLIFAFFRAVISHAMANPFYPEFSVFVNVIHLIEKDAWAGILILTVFAASIPALRPALSRALSRIFSLLAANVVLISVTASYIVWLHLKEPANLFRTQWGEALLPLLVSAVFLIGLRVYHTFARLYASGRFGALAPFTLAVECAFAILVVYYSSVVIITSPPLPAPGPSLHARDQGVSMTLAPYLDEDGMSLLALSGGAGELGEPAVLFADGKGKEEVSVGFEKVFENGYVFPSALLSSARGGRLSVSVPQEGGYDAQVSFEIPEENKPPGEVSGAHRPFDLFALVMTFLALTGILIGMFLLRFSKRSSPYLPSLHRAVLYVSGTTFFVMLYVGVALAILPEALGAARFRALCEADGNMWHLMRPLRAGVYTSETPREGCMGLMGAYHFVDMRAYEYNRTPGVANVSLDAPERIIAGMPARFSITLTNDDEPAELFLEHERFLHVIFVSRDKTYFSHVHPDDSREGGGGESGSPFSLVHTFPKAGTYIVAVDYAHRLEHGSKTFIVTVEGAPQPSAEDARYPSPAHVGGYEVALDYSLLRAGEVSTMQFFISKDGVPVSDIEPYLGAAMHVALVKEDLSTFLHTHGEVHPPGKPIPPVIVKDGKILHTANSMYLPPRFASPVDAHVIFPSAGLYTVWGEFKADGKTVRAAFTVRVEE